MARINISQGSTSNSGGYIWKGAWQSGTPYNDQDQVGNGGDLFICVLPHTAGAANEPGVGANWEQYWSRQVNNVTADQQAALDANTNLNASNPVAAITDAMFPTADQKAALAGSSGTPGDANRYVTRADPLLMEKYADIATGKAASGVDKEICYVESVETFYRYEADGSSYAADDTFVLTTGDGGNTKWLAMGGLYSLQGLLNIKANNGRTVRLQAAGDASYFAGSDGYPVRFGHLNTTRVNISGDGDLVIGLGNTDASARLHAYRGASGATNPVFLAHEDSDSNTGVLIKGIHDGTGDLLQLFNGANQRFTITDDGDVGIGTDAVNPASRLDLGAGAITLAEMAPPGTPAANKSVLYLVDNAGSTELKIKFANGTVKTIATDMA
jgi:hypothetical protein